MEGRTTLETLEAARTRSFLKVLEFPIDWWRRVDSNHGPTDYETVALAT